jgi:hypothetical protein
MGPKIPDKGIKAAGDSSDENHPINKLLIFQSQISPR